MDGEYNGGAAEPLHAADSGTNETSSLTVIKPTETSYGSDALSQILRESHKAAADVRRSNRDMNIAMFDVHAGRDLESKYTHREASLQDFNDSLIGYRT